jgi:hypothetical protein
LQVLLARQQVFWDEVLLLVAVLLLAVLVLVLLVWLPVRLVGVRCLPV